MEGISLPKIFPRVAYAVESFGFKFVQDGLPPPLLEGNRDRLGKQPSLFDQVDDCPTHKLQCVHGRMQQFSLTCLKPCDRPEHGSTGRKWRRVAVCFYPVPCA